jgi:hypothetical protein
MTDSPKFGTGKEYLLLFLRPSIFPPGFGECQFIGRVIFIDSADILDGFLANRFGNHKFEIAKPQIRIKAFTRGFLSQVRDPRRPGIVGGEDHERLVHGV